MENEYVNNQRPTKEQKEAILSKVEKVRKYDINSFSLDTFKEAIKEYYYGKDNPDIVINEDDNTFYATIGGKLTTGYGRLQMYFDNFDNIDYMKVKYNGDILNLEEKQKLFNRIKNEN